MFIFGTEELLKRWTVKEIAYMELHADKGAEAIAIVLGRTIQSVKTQASRYGISLQKRWLCPRCNRYTYTPLSIRTGWCRVCTIEESLDTTAIRNREARKELEAERRRIEELEKARQAMYSDTERRRRETKRIQREENK